MCATVDDNQFSVEKSICYLGQMVAHKISMRMRVLCVLFEIAELDSDRITYLYKRNIFAIEFVEIVFSMCIVQLVARQFTKVVLLRLKFGESKIVFILRIINVY
jgi:hypothetical protein